MKKICRICKKGLDTTCFNKKSRNKDGLENFCKECSRDRAKDYYKSSNGKYINTIHERRKVRRLRNQNFIRDFVSDKCCIDCGNKDQRVFQFDHIFDNKSYNITHIVSEGMSLETLAQELNKCVIRCANCHQIKTAIQLGWKHKIFEMR